MAWHYIHIAWFGGPEVLEPAEQEATPEPVTGKVRNKILAAGTGFTDAFIRPGRYSDFKGKQPFTSGLDLAGSVEKTGPGVNAARLGKLAADLCVTGGCGQYAIRPRRFLEMAGGKVDWHREWRNHARSDHRKPAP
jgi:NADPH:quinone reductase-like Zn-dependent oxidoreductase